MLATKIGIAAVLGICAQVLVHAEAAEASTASADSPRGTTGSGSVRFIENLGQWPESVRFAADIGGVVARAECEGLGFHAVDAQGRGSYVRLVFDSARLAADPRGVDPRTGVHHYYLGNDPSRWRTNARAFARIEYDEIYPGVDLVLYADGANPKYDLHFEAGVDPGVVRARWLGATHTSASSGGLALQVGEIVVHELPVVAWQRRPDGVRIPVTASWVVDAAGMLHLDALALDPELPLTVDPEVVWGTYLGTTTPGGGTEGPEHLEVGPDESTYAIGHVALQSFPSTPGAYVHAPAGAELTTVTRLRPNDGNATYAAVIGGTAWSVPTGISVDDSGRALVSGFTEATDFPTTAQAFDNTLSTFRSGYLFRLSNDGSTLEFSTLLEGNSNGVTDALDCRACADGTSLVVGSFAGSPDFPVTMPPIGNVPPPGPAYPGFYGSYVARLDATGSHLAWSRLIGDKTGAWQVEQTRAGDVVIVGNVTSPTMPTTPGVIQPVKPHPTNTILFAMRLASDGSDLQWSTFLGTAELGEDSLAYSLTLDDFDNLTFVFDTDVRNFPTTPDAFQTSPPGTGSFNGGGIVRMSRDGTRLIASTYLSDATSGALGAPTVDRSGVITLIGTVGSFFPSTPGAADEVLGPGSERQLARMDPYGRRFLHLRHFGGPYPKILTDAVVHADRTVSVAGIVQPPGGMPTTPGSFQPDYPGGTTTGFVLKFDLVVAGVTDIGTGTPACHGTIVTQAWRSPASGASDFGLYCSGAPENARGALLLGQRASAPATFGGATLHVDRGAGLRMLRVRADEFGYLETPLPIPALPVGSTYTAQYLFQNHAACEGSGRLSSSNAVLLTIQ